MTTSAGAAAYYQAHKDDQAEWGEPVVEEQGQSRRLASMISIRLTPDEADRVREAAATRGESLSQFVRESALRRTVELVGSAYVSFQLGSTLSSAIGESLRATTSRTVGIIDDKSSEFSFGQPKVA